MNNTQPLRVGIGGPVGSGKTALTLALCRALRDKYNIAVVTNDIYTEEDAQFLVRNEALVPERIIGVETGGCPHTAIREDASINLEATRVSGTIIVKEAPLSGSSLWWSLQGYQTLAPIPWHATLIHGLPRLSFSQTQPPSHGGRIAS